MENVLCKEFVDMLKFISSKKQNAMYDSKAIVNPLQFTASLKSWPSFGWEP